MVDLAWYLSRLRAMSAPEVAWRISQERIERRECRAFAVRRRVDDIVFDQSLVGMRAEWSRLPLHLENRRFRLKRDISLLGGYNYDEFKTRWHAGFQTESDWPLECAHKLVYKHRDEVGDARTNWELNRGHQFSLLAKGWYASRDVTFLDELEQLVDSWCEGNPFMWGISWTSVMEIAIRCINWMYAAAFLSASEDSRASRLAARFESGCTNMAAHVADHYSRYSSANNHAVVEACALGLAGMVFGNQRWQTIARDVLEAEVARQNHADGVNKEQALHYQVFLMEAVGLYILACRQNGAPTPAEWQRLLARMSNYVRDCSVAPGVSLEFGDDDEGVILALCGAKSDTSDYVLQMMSIALDEDARWSDFANPCETIQWLCGEEEIQSARKKRFYDNAGSVTYPEGGVTIIRSFDGRVVVGMDHGPLGFGSIAAHGHADALSVQLYVDGGCVIGDPGTYIYHADLPMRNELRQTRNHSTVCVDGKDQSEMIGAFMWGKRAETRLLETGWLADRSFVVEASHNGYAPIVHSRRIHFDGARNLLIEDRVDGRRSGIRAELVYAIPTGIEVSVDGRSVELSRCGQRIASLRICGPAINEVRVEPMAYSERYGVLSEGKRISVAFPAKATQFVTTNIEVLV